MDELGSSPRRNSTPERNPKLGRSTGTMHGGAGPHHAAPRAAARTALHEPLPPHPKITTPGTVLTAWPSGWAVPREAGRERAPGCCTPPSPPAGRQLPLCRSFWGARRTYSPGAARYRRPSAPPGEEARPGGAQGGGHGDEAGGTERGGAGAAWRSGPGPAPPGGAGWERNEEGARRSGPSLSSAGAAPGAAAAPPPCGAGGWRAGAATAAPALVFVSGPGGPLAAAAAPPSAGVRTPRLARPPGPGLTAQAPPPWRSSPRLRVPGWGGAVERCRSPEQRSDECGLRGWGLPLSGSSAGTVYFVIRAMSPFLSAFASPALCGTVMLRGPRSPCRAVQFVSPPHSSSHALNPWSSRSPACCHAFWKKDNPVPGYYIAFSAIRPGILQS